MRRSLLATAAAVALGVAPIQARADALSDIAEAVTKAQEGDMEGLILQLLAYFGIYGTSICSYLNLGARCWDRLFPDDPDWVTVGDAKWYVNERLEDSKSRTQEAMDVASTIISQQPFNAAKLMTLQAANVSPVSLFAAIQIGNEIEAESVSATHKQNGLLAELGQLQADQKLSEDWQKVMNYKWAKYHYQDNAFWTGDRTWQPETVDMGW